MNTFSFVKDSYSTKSVENKIKDLFSGYSNVKVKFNKVYECLVIEFKDTGQCFSINVQEE